MALPVSTTTAADAYAQLRNQAGLMQTRAQQLVTQLQGSTAMPEFLLDCLSLGRATVTRCQQIMATPGLVAYSQTSIGGGSASVTGTTTAGSATVTAISDPSQVVPGMTVTGPAFAASTFVRTVDPANATATLNQAPIVAGTAEAMACVLDLKTLVDNALTALQRLVTALLAEYPQDATTKILQDRTFDAFGNLVWARPAATGFPQTLAAAQAFLATVA